MASNSDSSNNSMLVTFVKYGIGGITTIWRSLAGDDDRVRIVWYQPDDHFFIDELGVFHFDLFAPKARIFKLLQRYILSHLADASVFVANEEFDLEFLNWLKPTQPISYIAHVNGDHSYKAAMRFKSTIDAFYTVAAPAENYLRCRGLSPVHQICYSITLPLLTLPKKEDIVIYLGRFACDKNIAETARHLEYFKSKGFRSIWIGDGPEQDEIQRISKCEIITGISRDDLYQLLARARFLILSSYYEGLPVILFECINYKIMPILSYVDSSCNEILNGSFVLASRDPAATYTTAISASSSFPKFHPRINNPLVNQNLVTMFVSISSRKRGKIYKRDLSLLDRFQSHLFSSCIVWIRRTRWRVSQNRK